MIKSIIMNKKWQKVVFIAFSMFYTAYALLAFTMFKKLPWYKPLRDFGDENFYYFFGILALFIVVRKYLEFYEKHQHHYNIIEAVFAFIYEHVILAFLGIAFYIAYLMMISNGVRTRVSNVPLMFYYLVCASDFEFDDYLPYLFGASAGMMIATIVCNKIGILPDILYQRSATRVGHSLGYIWPLTFHAHLFILMLLYMAIRKEKFTIIEFIILSALNAYATFLSTAKTGAGLTELALIGALLLHYEKPRALFRRLIGLAYAWMLAAPLISFATAALYSPQSRLWISLNAKLNNRPLMQYNALNKYGVQLFGRRMHWRSFGNNHQVQEKDYNFVDNSFMKYSFENGLIYLLFLVPGFIFAIYRFSRKENYSAIWCIILIFMFGLFQHQALLLTINPFLLTVSPLFLVGISDIADHFYHHEESN